MKSIVLGILLLAALFTVPAAAAEPSSDLQRQLTEARAQLDVLKQKYSDQHPMVREQRAKVTALEKQAADDPLKTTRDAQQMVMPKPQSLSIDFPGGSIRAFLTAVSKLEGISVSIIASGEQGDLETQLPPFSLKNTNAMIAVQVLSRLLQPRGFELTPMAGDMNSVVAVLSRHEPAKAVVPRQSPSEFESFQVAPYLADQSIEDIVAAIRTAWELDPSRDPNSLRLKFHPATSILLVSGPRDGLNMAAKIISQLKAASDGGIAHQRPSSADAERRQQAVADEVVRRRQEREKGAGKVAVPTEKK